jgi:hypothetical protein
VTLAVPFPSESLIGARPGPGFHTFRTRRTVEGADKALVFRERST